MKTLSPHEVVLAPEGTPLARFQKERTDAISEMFDNEDEHGIYPTGKFFARIDKCFENELAQKLAGAKEAKSVPMGVSQWREHGKKYGYDEYFKEEAFEEMRERVERLISYGYATDDESYPPVMLDREAVLDLLKPTKE